MNGYDLHRMRLNFRFDNPDKCRSIHSELFMYVCDLWNRLGQKKQFGLPTQMTMELLGIGSYNTYTKAYQDLVDWGFIKEIQKSTNQYSSRIIAISKIDKATDKSLDKATIKATDETSDDIIKQRTINKEQRKSMTFIAPTVDDVITYFKEKGYKEEIAKKAREYYDVANRSDSKGNKVKNWKQKMQSVRFKEEHKQEIYTLPDTDLGKAELYVKIGRPKYKELFGIDETAYANQQRNILLVR